MIKIKISRKDIKTRKEWNINPGTKVISNKKVYKRQKYKKKFNELPY